jgi:hypothetical protein
MSGEADVDASRGIVEARKGFFRVGLEAAFSLPEPGRVMLNSL